MTPFFRPAPEFSSLARATSSPERRTGEKPTTAAEVRAKRDRIIERAEKLHHDRRPARIAEAYGDLFSKEGNAPRLQPPGMVDDRKSRLLAAAGYLADQKHLKRLRLINTAADRMISGKQNDLGR